MHFVRKACVIFLVICAAAAEDIANTDETPREGETHLQQYDQEWKIVVDYVAPDSDYVPKGRRVRKRKRRPSVLPQMKEPWEEVGGDVQITNSRRRLTPVFEESGQRFEKIRDPFTALQEAEERQKKKVDLKTVLKNSEGLSLSEVLQQKNLSLSELLLGNQEAISAIARETITTTEVGAALQNGGGDRSSEGSFQGIIESEKKRLILPDDNEDSKMNEETTESHHSTTIRKKKLPLTSAKLRKFLTHRPIESTSKVPEAVSINVDEVFSLRKNDTDTPFKMTIDLEDIAITTKKVEETTTEFAMEKLKRVTAKEEILEILKDPIQNERLSKILRTRNMSVEELVAQRERGSSQLHLADIFHNKTREPEPQDEPLVGHIFTSRKSKTMPIITQKGATTPKPTRKTAGTQLPYTITSFPTYKIETNKDLKGHPFLPIWYQLYPSYFSDVYANNQLTSTTTEKTLNYEEELERLEAIENALAEAANGELNVDLPHNIYDDDDFITLPSGVKSAILASLAIIGLSLIVFVTILMIFKWTQKQKSRLNYNGSFSSSKIKSPILEPDKRRTFRTFLSETLGKKNYYKTQLRNISDSIWETEEKKSYMI